MGHAIGIDVGTSNVKVALVAEDATIAAAATRPLVTRSSGEVATQDASALLDRLTDAIREVAAAAPDAFADIVTVGIDSQYSSIVPVGADHRPVGDMVMWTDTRGSDLCWAIMERHPEAFERWIEHHGIPPIGAGLSLAHVLELQVNQPAIHERATAYLEPMDFVAAHLTGRVAATQSTMFAAQLCDNRTLGATAYDSELVEMSGVDPTRLPELIGDDDVVGEVRSVVADELGLPRGVTVRASMNDSHASAFATGAFTDGRVGLMIGTTAVLLDAVDFHGVDLDHEVVSMPAPLPGTYLVWAENGVAGRSVEHAVGALLGRRLDDLDATLAATPAGAHGALFLPWLAGSLSPSANRAMRGGYLNVSFDTTADDLVRAAVEGTARNLRWLLPFVEAFSKHPTGEITFGGGAARSAGWAQVIADVVEHPVAVLANPGLGAAVASGAVALRRQAGEDPTDVALPVAARFEPDPSTAAVHAELQGAFEAAFEANRQICESLNQVL